MSFRERLSDYWFNTQFLLFPHVEQKVGILSEEYKKLVAVLELVRIEEFLPCTRFCTGRPTKYRSQIARAFVAKIILKIPFTGELIKRLEKDEQLRFICGWKEYHKVPDKSVFSRAFAEFADMKLPDKVHQALISDIYKDKIVGHLTMDSTPIIAREKAPKSSKSKISRKERKKLKNKQLAKEKREGTSRKQRQLFQNIDEMINELPTASDTAAKKGTWGYKSWWFGYKFSATVDDHCIPIACILTTASLNDSEVAIPLAKKSNRLVKNFYDLMDSAYDAEEIKRHSKSLGHIPIIDKHSRSKAQKAEKVAERKRRKLLNVQVAEDVRYRTRFSKERFNATFKDYYGGKNLYYRGHSKVFCHLSFGVLAMTATMLLKLIQ
jgi:hypothetical protein